MGRKAKQAGAPLVELRGAGAALLHTVDFRLEPGARWAVLGPNGAGKTTFLRLVRGEIATDEDRPDEGRTGADETGQGSRVLALRAGRVAFCGGREAYQQWKAARRTGRASVNI